MNKLGFGFLRLPRLPGEDKAVDYQRLNEMVDAFLAGGGKYFDTAYTYLNGLSEEALGKALVARHPRNSFEIATKLPGYKCTCKEDCWTFFETQCQRIGTSWFDVYLLHWLDHKHYQMAQQFEEFQFLQQLKAQGRARRIGFSYHGSAALLEQILTAHPEVDIVQLQINYLDWEDAAIESGKCYEIAARHGKTVVVMEPVKGGTLAELPREAMALLEAHAPGRSPAGWALQFVESLPAVEIALSGMGTMDQIRENLMERTPITPEERDLLAQVAQILTRSIAVPCTGCAYCVSHCPQGIPIPHFFRLYNSFCRHPAGEAWKFQPVYQELAQKTTPASACISCQACEANCPQGIEISQWMKQVAEKME